MPQLVRNSWAWFRTFLSEDGPTDRETRLTLVGHMRFMHGNGRGCWAGVRAIGVTTHQNKATVLKHRAKAISAGWLVLAPKGKSKYPGELWAGIPDGIKIDEKYLAKTVLSDSTARPTASDLTLNNSLLTPEEISDENCEPETDPEDTSPLARSRERRLRAWLAANATVKKYFHDIEAVVILTPVELRFGKFRKVIADVIAVSRAESSSDEK